MGLASQSWKYDREVMCCPAKAWPVKRQPRFDSLCFRHTEARIGVLIGPENRDGGRGVIVWVRLLQSPLVLGYDSKLPPICASIPTAEETGLDPVQSEFESQEAYLCTTIPIGRGSTSRACSV